LSLKHPLLHLLSPALRQTFPAASWHAQHAQRRTYAELWGLQAQLYQPG